MNSKMTGAPLEPLINDLKSPNTLKVYLGTNIGFTTKQDQVVLQIADKDLLTIHRTPKGMSVDAKIFSEDGRIVVGIERNIVRANLNNIYYVEHPPDEHSLIVHDQKDEVVLQLLYLNPSAVRVSGIFRYADHEPIVVSDEIYINKRTPMQHSVAGDSGGSLFHF